MQNLMKLEEQGWQALATSGEAGRQFYRSILADNALMLFPGGIVLEGIETILVSIDAQPWQSYQIEDPRVISLAEDVSAVAYKITAQRPGNDPYEALISSTYVLAESEWKLTLHQQTPIG